MLRILIFSIFASSAAFAAESGGMPQLDPNSWVPQIFWLIITFGGLYIVISKIVFPRLSESIEQRNDYVSDLVDEAKTLAEQTEKLNNEYKELISNSKKEAQEIITNGRKKLNDEFDNWKLLKNSIGKNRINIAAKNIIRVQNNDCPDQFVNWFVPFIVEISK